jgi:ABC-type transport system involved in multi-copper enzyme maturation permease subunit
MRLLRAELRKLRRPLSMWSIVAVLAIVGLFAWGSQKSVSDDLRFIAKYATHAPPCKAFGLPPGTDCARAQQQWLEHEKDEGASRGASEARAAELIRSPLGAGRMAAGMMASLVGAVVLLLLAAGHLGNEWSGRTIKQVLTQEGRRWRVLAAKLASLIVAGVTLLLVLWAFLAALAPLFDAVYPLGVRLSAGTDLHASLSAGWHSVVVIVAFAVLGMLCAVITRNTLGSFFLGFAFVIATIILSTFSAVTRWTLAYWVTGWMRFHTPNGLVTHLWRDEFPIHAPSVTAGLVGLAVFAAVCGALSLARLQGSDVKA